MLRGAAPILVLLTILLGSAPALASTPVTRYAGPNGTGPQPCTDQSNPCDFATAVAGPGVNGPHDLDTVVVLPGTYNLSSTPIDVVAELNIHSQPGSMPVINTTASPGITIEAGVDLSGLRINDANAAPLFVHDGRADRIFAFSQSNSWACLESNGTLKDSVCLNTGANGNGAGANMSSASPQNPVLRNVTAIATGSNSFGLNFTAGIGTTMTVNALNVIARGTNNDVRAGTNGSGASNAMSLDYSNFVTSLPSGLGASVTSANTLHNQSGAPAFVDAAAGDFHEAAGSPTINAGIAAADLGPSDLDGLARIEQGTPDIGAYEVHPPAPTAAPATHLKCKRHKKHRRAAVAKKRCKKHKHR